MGLERGPFDVYVCTHKRGSSPVWEMGDLDTLLAQPLAKYSHLLTEGLHAPLKATTETRDMHCARAILVLQCGAI
jgi:hypothetical protein